MEAYTITQIKRAKRHRKRYHIYINGDYQFSIHEDVLVKFGLHKGMSVDPVELGDWVRADEQAKIRQAVYRYLSYRARSAHEVRTYLAQKDWDPELCEQIITECIQQGYLNDRAFAEEWVKSRQTRKGLGKNRLRQELQKKGIASKDIEGVIAQIDEEEERQKAMELAERRYLRIQTEPWPKIERRIGQYLLRQGYRADMVYSILHTLKARKRDEEL